MKNTAKSQLKKYFLGLMQLICAVVFLTTAAFAANYTVTNTNDSGAGSLRAALTAANNSGAADYFIFFNIQGSGVKTISLQSPLPQINMSSDGHLRIDGTSQPNYSGVPLIELNGANAGAGADGLFLARGYLDVKGLIINRFANYGIRAECLSNCTSTSPTPLIRIAVRGSYIGTNAAGNAALGNGVGGIYFQSNGLTDSYIGAEQVSERNIISGNGLYGIVLRDGFVPTSNSASSNIYVHNNFIGTNQNGTTAVPNGTDGININFNNNGTTRFHIGSADAAERNIISGNGGNGIYMNASYGHDGFVKGNYIGTNSAGTGDLGNVHNGIHALGDNTGSGNIVIGGNLAGEGNVISGNNQNGILAEMQEMWITGNRIGTNAAGTAALGNTQHGIRVTRSITIGGTEWDDYGNTVSGNGGDGIRVVSSDPINMSIQGNKIGVNSGGTAAIPNQGNGITASAKVGISTLNTIGGNIGHGIELIGGASDIEIFNTYIGTNASGADLGNGGNGINIFSTVSKVYIGEKGAGVGPNTIAFNNGDGISLQPGFGAGAVADNISIRRNSIYSNSGLGIDLGPTNGVTPNDLNDADTGPNGLQNFPVLHKAYPNQIQGTLDSIPTQGGDKYKLDFYTVDSCDASGYGEGRYYLGFMEAQTGHGGNINFNFPLSSPLSFGQSVVATATSPAGNTSEFSQCLTVTLPPGNFSLDAATYSINETGGSITVTVNRTGGSGGAVSVQYAASNGTATAGTDYTATSGTLTFLTGQTTRTFTIPITNDTTDEPDETINITLSNPTGDAALVNPSAAVLTIVDNDNPPTISIKNYSAQEGNSGTTAFTFDVKLSEASGLPVSVNWKTLSGGTATPGSDYTAAGSTLNFAPGETSKQITVLVNGDAVSEPNEYFQVSIYQPVNITLDDSLANGTIFDEDNPGELQFSPAVYNVNEGVGTATVTVTRTTGTAGTVTVDYATTNTGTTSFPDFTPASGTLTFLDGEATKTFSVSITDDQIVEQTEWIDLVLSNVTGGAAITGGNALINIDDNDTASATSISGIVNYAITPINQSQKKVPGVLVYATGPGNGAATSDSDGLYQINNLTAGGNYTVVASKTGDVNGISPFDATLVLKHVAANGQGPNVLSLNQQKAADANGDGNISPFDATLILRYVAAGGPTANTGQTGNWKFLPGTQNYQSLDNSLSGENYEAVLIGEINGNWTPPAPGSLAPTDNQDEIAVAVGETEAEISLPDNASAASGSIIVVPVSFANKSGKSISGYNFAVEFDPNVLQPDSAMPIDTSATLSREMTVVHNTAQTGRIGIAASGNLIERISKGDVLLKLRFRVVGTANDLKNPATALTFHQQPIIENESGAALAVKSVNGSIRVSAGDAGKSVTTVSGQVTTAEGRGIRNVSVTLTDANGETRTVLTGEGGEYSFADVSSGETYTISVSSKRFRFNSTSQMRTIFADAEEINFTALE
jgi:hypothetical protein